MIEPGSFSGIDTEALIELIKSNVDPESWEGPKAAIAIARGNLVVTQTPAAHVKLREMLRMLRSMR